MNDPEIDIANCDTCRSEWSAANAAGETEIWMNHDGHVARERDQLEDRNATYAKYGV